MSMPQIAIVGRPNVGKSSLLNMLARAKISIVDPTPGVTRDRVSALIEVRSPDRIEPTKLAEIVDTGGYGVYTAQDGRFNEIGEDLGSLTADIEQQIGLAVRDADTILFVIDAQDGITTLDQTVAQLLRERAFDSSERTPPKILLIANKVDGEKWEPHGYEAAALGFGEPVLVSAMNNYFRNGLLDALYEAIPDITDEEEEPRTEMRIAIIGKRNSGKSTFVNKLAGEERMIVSDIAGTTRDSVDVRFEFDGKSFVAIDTAGFRKKKSLADQIEWYATHRALRSVRRSDVVLLMLDATAEVSQVDKHLTKEIQEQHKPVVIVVNKWDLTEGRKNRKGEPINIGDYRQYIERELKGLSRAPIVFTTATDGQGVDDAIELAYDLFNQSQERVSTGKLNTIFRDMLSARGPTSRLGTQAKVLFVSQVSIAPPTIVLVVNHANLFTSGYRRYILNRLAESTPFTETPVRLIIRDRKRARLEDLLSGKHRSAQELEGIDADIIEDTPASYPKRPKMPRVVHGLADADPKEKAIDAATRRKLDEIDEKND